VPSGHAELELKMGVPGFPCGHVVEAYGHAYATAGLLEPTIRAETLRAGNVGVVDCDGSFARPDGVEPAAVDARRATTLGDALRRVRDLVRAGRRLVVVHQFDALLPDGPHGDPRACVGPRAQIARGLRSLLPLIDAHGAAVVFVTRRFCDLPGDFENPGRRAYALHPLVRAAAVRLSVFQVPEAGDGGHEAAESLVWAKTSPATLNLLVGFDAVMHGAGYEEPGRAGSAWVVSVMKNELGPCRPVRPRSAGDRVLTRGGCHGVVRRSDIFRARLPAHGGPRPVQRGAVRRARLGLRD
jgi:hypothetical protein